MKIHWINIKPTQDNIKTVEIITGNVLNSNDNNKNDINYLWNRLSPNTLLYEVKNIWHKTKSK